MRSWRWYFFGSQARKQQRQSTINFLSLPTDLTTTNGRKNYFLLEFIHQILPKKDFPTLGFPRIWDTREIWIHETFRILRHLGCKTFGLPKLRIARILCCKLRAIMPQVKIRGNFRKSSSIFEHLQEQAKNNANKMASYESCRTHVRGMPSVLPRDYLDHAPCRGKRTSCHSKDTRRGSWTSTPRTATPPKDPLPEGHG